MANITEIEELLSRKLDPVQAGIKNLYHNMYNVKEEIKSFKAVVNDSIKEAKNRIERMKWQQKIWK